jgi:hypothetical protein
MMAMKRKAVVMMNLRKVPPQFTVVEKDSST